MAESSQANSTRVTEQLTPLGIREFGCLEKKIGQYNQTKTFTVLVELESISF